MKWNSEKRRVPSWCDRILWHDTSKVKLISYTRAELKLSDHKPVSLILKTNAKKIIENKKKQIISEITKQLDRQENDSIVQCELSKSVLEFGDVYYMQPVTRSLTIKNIAPSSVCIIYKWSIRNN